MVLGKFVFSAWLFCSCVLFFVLDSRMVAWQDYVRLRDRSTSRNGSLSIQLLRVSMCASRSSARFCLHLVTGPWHTGSSSVSGADLRGQARHVPSTRRASLDILPHSELAALAPHLASYGKAVAPPGKEAIAEHRLVKKKTLPLKYLYTVVSSVSDFAHFVVFYRPRLSVKSPSYGTAT